MCERANLPTLQKGDFSLLEEGAMNIKDDYDCRQAYNAPLSTDEPNPVFVKQFYGCDTLGPVDDIVLEFDEAGCPHLGVMVPTIAAAEAKAGGDSSHDFQDQGWYNHERSKCSAPQTLHESEGEPGEIV